MAHHHPRGHHKPKNPDWPREQSKQHVDIVERQLAREERHRQRGPDLGAAIVLPPYVTAILNGPHGLAKVRPRPNGDDPTYAQHLLMDAARGRIRELVLRHRQLVEAARARRRHLFMEAVRARHAAE